MEDHEHIDKHLKNSLAGFSVTPKMTSYDAVLQKLEKRKKRRMLLWFIFPGVLFFSGILFFYSLFSTVVEPNISQSLPSISTTKLPERKQSPSVFQKSNSSSAPKSKPSDPNTTPSNQKSPNEKTVISKSNTPAVTENKKLSEKPNAFEDTPSANSNLKEPPLITLLKADTLKPIQAFLPSNDVDRNISHLNVPVTFQNFDSIPSKQKKRITFLLGLNVDPQFSAYHFTKNKNRSNDFNSGNGQSFPDLYLENRKKQNALKYNFGFGITGGLRINDTWDMLFGIGYKGFKAEEKLYLLTDGNKTTGLSSSPNANYDGAVPGSKREPKRGNLRYLYYSFDAAKYLRVQRFTKLKLGVGIHVNQLIRSNVVMVAASDTYYSLTTNKSERAPLRKWLYTTNLKIGFVHDLGKRTELHFCPTIFYSINSVFNKSYVIQQRPFGLNLECLLLFKLN